MSDVILLVLVIVIVFAVGALSVAMMTRRMSPRRQAGPEYDRLVREMGTRRARSEFAKRRQRVDGLAIKSLTPEQRDAYEDQWTAAQARFIDSPPEAVRTATELVASVAADRGYPVGDDSQLLTDLSVYHGRRLDGYRRARRIAEQAEMAATEQLRQALLDQRALFRDLLESAEYDAGSPRTPRKLALAWPGR